MKRTLRNTLMDQGLVILPFLVLGLLALAIFVLVSEPPERRPRPITRPAFSEEALDASLARHTVVDHLRAIAAAGSRMTGTPGAARVEALVSNAFTQAGLEVLTQAFPVTVPVTEWCEIRDADTGALLADVDLHPLLPAGIVPVNCTITTRLAVAESASLQWLSGHDPRETTVITTVRGGAGWSELAAAGAPALVVYADPDSEVLRADPDEAEFWNGVVTGVEHPFPIFFARGPIREHAGRRVTINCRVTWQPREARNVIGVLRGATAHAEALVLSAYMDSSSVVPDLAPGAEQAIPLATLLATMDGLVPYREVLARDVLFVATAGHAQGLAGASHLLEAMEPFRGRRPGDARVEDLRAAAQTAWRTVDEDPELARIAAGEVHLRRREETLAARLAYLRAGSPVYRDGFDAEAAGDEARKQAENRHPLLADYLRCREAENAAGNLVSAPAALQAVHAEFRDVLAGLRAQAAAWQEQRVRHLDDRLAVRDRFARYDQTFTLNLELNSGGRRRQSDLSLLVGLPQAGPVTEPQVSDMAALLMRRTPGLRVHSWGAADAAGSVTLPNRNSPDLTELESELWFFCGRLSFSLCNHAFLPGKLGTPEDRLESLDLEVLRTHHVPAAARLALALAGGEVAFKPVPPDNRKRVISVSGTVYGDAGAATMVPSHPMGQRTVVRPVPTSGYRREGTLFVARGVMVYPPVTASPYGTYTRSLCADFDVWGRFNVDAARFDDAGRLSAIADASPSIQSVYPSVNLDPASWASAGRPPRPVQVAVFRSTPVTLYPCVNPQTQQPFKAVRLLQSQGLTEPTRVNQGPLMTFVEPDFTFFVSLLDGAADNPEILAPRAFLLNTASGPPDSDAEADLAGAGFLAADTPVITAPTFEAAASMVRTAGKRLQLQQRYHMADEQMLDFHARAGALRDEALRFGDAREPLAAANAAADSLAYAMANHPVIRGRINQAVVGILWYLGLLVPFVFFAEKLLCGFTDIRKQLVAGTVIFLIVFTLLRLFHPAFQMVRSSLMILLGFIILLLTLLVTAMVGGKFRQNLTALRRREGRVEGADINRGGVVGTAFMLGLNNMRRRKVRTGLTCVTLILMTFVMICFTSVSTDLVEVEQATGRSPWNGIMVRNPHYRGMPPAQVSAIERRYGAEFPMASIMWLIPQLNSALADRLQNPDVQVDRAWEVGGQLLSRRTTLNSAVQMDWNEPAFSGIDRILLTRRAWFPRPPATAAELAVAARRGEREGRYVFLPEPAAHALGLTVAQVDQTNVTVTIRDTPFEVLGIFDPAALARVQGLDGRSLLPFDVNSVQQLGQREGRLVVPEDIGRLDPSQVMIVNEMPPLRQEELAIVYCSVLFPREPYRLRADAPEQPAVEYTRQRRLVTDYLERLGQPAYYAVDGTAYYGSRLRARSLTGLLQLLMPLLIAALTVFNTMRGSVYERRGEIFVYNAVGIAPNHVFFMFMAEACVYAVVGAMCGYVLSQATGRALTALGVTGGLNLDYSSVETIYASLAIMGAVMVSTLLPARDAARMASPSGHVGWTLPDAQGDLLTFDLPFTFTPRDRLAVLAYFRRWMEANGAGSSGPFYCADPEWIALGPEGAPALRSTVWLKPYDLGVSQTLELSLPLDSELREFVAHVRLTRLSGHAAAWRRTAKPFLGSLRKQFLNWRATTAADRDDLYAEADRLLRTQARREEAVRD